jgi:hypothetical protein
LPAPGGACNTAAVFVPNALSKSASTDSIGRSLRTISELVYSISAFAPLEISRLTGFRFFLHGFLDPLSAANKAILRVQLL